MNINDLYIIYIMDPKQIRDYNKFLCALDEKSKKIKKEPIVKEIKEDKEDKDKETIDTIVNNIKSDFDNDGLSSSTFTGQTKCDIYTVYAGSDPNRPYDTETDSKKKRDGDRERQRQGKRKLVQIDESKYEKKTVQNIFIEDEINSITDILKIIETYKVSQDIEYNIDVKTLHNIKEPLEELNRMIGMKELKNNIVDQILYFVQGLHRDKKMEGDFMHTVIHGPPGTGKTEIAKIMGLIYSKMGVLSKGTFKKVTRCDLIAGYLGQTALKTRDVIKDAIGGVLFIDEAYSLGNPEKRDSFAKECIDTLCEALSDNKADLMVIVAGYENELKECFFKYNTGLESRFTWRFKTDDYTYEDLFHIFIKNVDDIGWKLEDKNVKSDWFKKNINFFKYYGRDIETFLSKTKIAHSRRVFSKPLNEKKIINLKDLENGFKIYVNESKKSEQKELENKNYLLNTLYS